MPNELFNTVAMPRIPGNTFDLSHEVKLSFDIGELVPTCVLDCIPGDVFRISPQTMLRFAPLISPIMHKVETYTHFFFVPYRLLWSGFEDFITGASDVVAPYVAIDNENPVPEGSVADYLGFPTLTLALATEIRVTPYFFAAYRLIYDQYYRDENLEVAEVFVPLTAGDNTIAYGPGSIEYEPPLVRALEHDYFTSCLPFAQKGNPVMLPLTFSAGVPVQLDSASQGTPNLIRDADDHSLLSGTPLYSEAVTGVLQTGADTGGSVIDPNGTWIVDIQSDAVTLETLRTAIVLQEFLERDARSGTRYTEKIQGQFGVRSSDARLQRPEYIGGTKSVMAISEVLATAQSSDDPATATQFVGQMAGHGVSVMGGNNFTFKVEEFGCILGITSVIPETAYSDGLHRSWIKQDAIEDFAWPAFSNLGEQLVTMKEVYLAAADLEEQFGYQARYAEYKSMPSRVAGEFRTSLSFWHLAQMFDTEPTLSNDFIKAYPSKFNRIFAVPGDEETPVDHIYARVINNVTAFRKLPRFGIPSFGSTNMG